LQVLPREETLAKQGRQEDTSALHSTVNVGVEVRSTPQAGCCLWLCSGNLQSGRPHFQ
jgi:hypothetical protein